MGLSALSGYPALTILTGMYICLWAAGRSLWANNVDGSATEVALTRRIAQGARTLAIWAATGIVVLSPCFFAFFYEGPGYHSRVGPLSRFWAVQVNALHPGALATLASPYLPLLKFKYPALWNYTDVSSCSIYAGVLVTMFGVLALVRRSEPFRLWVAGIAALNLGCALGIALPLRGWMYDLLPPTRYFRHSSMFRCYFVFSLCVLAIWGLKDLSKNLSLRQSSCRRKLLFIVPACGICAACAIMLVTRSVGSNLRDLPSEEIFRFAILWTTIFSLAIAMRFLTASMQTRLVIPALILIAVFDGLISRDLSAPIMEVQGRNAEMRWAALDRSHSSAVSPVQYQRRIEPCGNPCDKNDQLIDKVPVVNGYSAQESWYYQMFLNSPELVRTALGKDRTWFSASAVQLPWTEGCFAEFEKEARASGQIPLIVEAPSLLLHPAPSAWIWQTSTAGCQTALGHAESLEPISIALLRSEPDALDVSLQAPRDGWVLFTDRWARGWRAKVNGRAVPVFSGNFVFRAVRVKSGANRIEFRFVPNITLAFVVLSWATLGFVALGTLLRARPV